MKKKALIICVCVVVLAIIVAIPIIIINRPKSLFNINPNKVASISIKNGGTGATTNITDASQINQVVKDINNFRYIKKQSLYFTYGWFYSVDFDDSSGNSLLEFVLVTSNLINYGNNSYELPSNSTITVDYFNNLTSSAQ